MKRFWSLMLVVVMVLCIFTCTPISATEIELSSLGAWSNSYSLSGNGSDDIVAVALAQFEKTGTQLGYSDKWCAAFVSDCAIRAGQAAAIPYHALASSLYTNVRSAGGYEVSSPQKGDLAFYKQGSNFTHVSIVLDGNGNTVHGNVSWCNSIGRDDGVWHVCTRRPNEYENAMNEYHVYVRPNYNGGIHTHNYNTLVYYGKSHPHYNYYQCSCGEVMMNTNETRRVEGCSECYHTTHNYNTLVYYGKSHPHYNYYQCSCGEVMMNTNEPTLINNCDDCVTTIGKTFYAKITNSRSGKSLGVNDTNVELQNKNNSDAQKWLFELQSDNSYKITNVATGKCLDVDSAGQTNGTNIRVHNSNDTAAQRFFMTVNNTGYTIVPMHNTNFALDIANGDFVDGANIQIYIRNSSIAQTFSIEYLDLEPAGVAQNENGKKYEYYDFQTSWIEAYNICESKGGHLVTIGSEDENVYVYNIASSFDNDFCWIGGTGFEKEGEYYWISDELFLYENWSTGEPNNDSDENYMEMYVHVAEPGTWNDVKNAQLLHTRTVGFICEYEKDEITSVYVPSKTFSGNESTYEVFEYSVDWQTAQRICEAKGGHLVVIDDDAEQNLVHQNIQDVSKDEFWMGIKDVSSEGNWSDVNGKDVTFYNWTEGEPNNFLNCEDYLAIKRTDGKWNDVSGFRFGYRSYGFICEYDNIESDTSEPTNTVVTDPTEATTASTVATEPTEATTASTVATDPTEATTASTVATDPTEATTESTVVTDPTKVTTEPTVVTDPTEATTESTVVTDPTEATTESTIVTDPTEATTESTVVTDPTEATTESTIVTDPTEATTESTVVTDPTEETTASSVVTDPTEVTTESTVVTEPSTGDDTKPSDTTEPSTGDDTEPSGTTEPSTGDDTKPSEPVVDKGILGDVNGDGKVNIKDATQIQKFAAKLIDLTEDEKLRADVNADNKNNVKDATAIQKFVAKIETGFPIGESIVKKVNS